MKPSITPKKSLGQNFLANPRILDKIVAAAELTKEDVVIEVGPGTGNLTAKLAEKAGKIIAVEKDRRLIASLREKFRNSNVEIIEADILKLKIETLIENWNLKIKNYKIVGNIPYYLTSNLLRTMFERWPKPELIVLTIQKEVAQRITAKPPRMSLLAVSVQFFSEPKIISHVSKENFRPRPKVDSAIIKLIPKKIMPNLDQGKFFKLIKAAFSWKRKQIVNTLPKLIKNMDQIALINLLNKAGINPQARPETIDMLHWIALANQL